MMPSSTKSSLLAAAALALSFGGATASPIQDNTPRHEHRALPTQRPASDLVRKAVRGGNLRHLHGGYPQGPGWTVAQVKRMAAKDRNVARHKAHCKGGSARNSRKAQA